jgi:hypothetical protein
MAANQSTEPSLVPSGAYYPLSEYQEERLASRELVHPHSELSVGYISTGLCFKGQIDPSAINRALAEVVRRHVALRAAILRNLAISPTERLAQLLKFRKTGLIARGLYWQCIVEPASRLLKS